jgi:membrane-associated phospholipid phosphatase
MSLERETGAGETGPLKRPRRGWIVAIVIFVMLAAVAFFTVDARVVHWVHEHRIDAWAKRWVWVRKLRFDWPGHFFCTIVIAALVGVFHRTHLRGAAMLLIAGVLTGANSVVKWVAGRSRPDWTTGTPDMTFHPFAGGVKRLFVQGNLAFPSGDAALAVATAATLSYLIPRWRLAWWFMAVVVAAQRVAENAHHVSDVLAAAALGVAAFHCARVACRLLPDSGDSLEVEDGNALRERSG